MKVHFETVMSVMVYYSIDILMSYNYPDDGRYLNIRSTIVFVWQNSNLSTYLMLDSNLYSLSILVGKFQLFVRLRVLSLTVYVPSNNLGVHL